MDLYRQIDRRLAEIGMFLRGGFHPEPEEGLEAATVMLIGNAGPTIWSAFSAAGPPSGPDPFDRWTERVVSAVAEEVGASAVFPFGGPPYRPFMQWAKRSDAIHSAPFGLLIHPDYGLWHAYRGALLFDRRQDLPPRDTRPSPCETCTDRPCLTTCPVGALAPERYDVPACKDHIASAAGRDCLEEGCRARRACPIGRDYHYRPDQAELHMRAFLGREPD